MKKEKITIYILIMILIFESAAFAAFVTCNAIFINDYKAALDKAAYVDEMAEKDYQRWRKGKL